MDKSFIKYITSWSDVSCDLLSCFFSFPHLISEIRLSLLANFSWTVREEDQCRSLCDRVCYLTQCWILSCTLWELVTIQKWNANNQHGLLTSMNTFLQSSIQMSTWIFTRIYGLSWQITNSHDIKEIVLCLNRYRLSARMMIVSFLFRFGWATHWIFLPW